MVRVLRGVVLVHAVLVLPLAACPGRPRAGDAGGLSAHE
jgi:hypothetical protein